MYPTTQCNIPKTWIFRKFPAPGQNQTQVIQLVTSHYNDWAIAAPYQQNNIHRKTHFSSYVDFNGCCPAL